MISRVENRHTFLLIQKNKKTKEVKMKNGFILHFSRHQKCFTLNLLFIHTGGKLHVQPQLPWGRLREVWLTVCTERPL